MAQNGFAIFFALLIVGCAITLLISLVESWPRIVAAINSPSGPEPVARRYTSRQRRPIDIPEVAQRMVLRDTSERPWARQRADMPMFQRSLQRANQLRFEFA